MAGTANNGRRTGNGKKTAGSKSRKQTQKKRGRQDSGFMRSEVLILASFAAALLLFLSNFHLCGIAGDYVRKIQLGIFGMLGFIAPLILFAGTCYALSNQGNPMAVLKLTAVIVGLAVLCGLAELLFGGGLKGGRSLGEVYLHSSENGAGGGFLGGLLALLLSSVLGTVGAYLVLLVLLVICVVCITERSVVSAVKKGGGRAYQYAREDVDRRRVQHEERRRLREEQRVRGVNLASAKLEANPECQVGYEGQNESEVPKEAKGTAEKTAADIFTGSISLSPVYIEEEDTVPFEAEKCIEAEEKEESVRELFVRRDTRTLDEMEMAGDYSIPGDSRHREEFSKERQYGEVPEEDFSVPEEDGYEEESDERDSYEETSPERRGVYSEFEVYDEEEDSQMPMGGYESMSERSADLESDRREERNVSEGRDRGGDFSIPQERKRVVTASGRIIENDTEALKKKLENRQEEIRTARDAAAAYQIETEPVAAKEYEFPPMSLLKKGNRLAGSYSDKEYRETAIKLQQTLRNFGVGVTVTNVSCGPSVTRYELHPEQGVKVSRIVALADDIKLNLAAPDIRIEAPIPGKSAVGIEVPNKENTTVYLRDLLESEEFKAGTSNLTFAVGKDIGGQVVVTDVAKMPHLLIAGATGSGKSVCINTLIMSLIYKAKPEDVKMIMIDPKVVELSAYNGIPHLLIPVVTDPKKASGALNWAVAEMMDRYKKFSQYNVRDLKGYNAKIENIRDIEAENKPQKLPQIVIIVDELADLMMVSPGEVEDAICRLAQLARAAGLHLVIATQRPSVNVITGLIKANVPSRIAFSVSSGVDSRTIIDMNGAEKLLGKGDMLFYPSGYQKPQRVQGAFVSDQEVSSVVEFLTAQTSTPVYNPEIENQISLPQGIGGPGGGNNGRDEYFAEAGRFIIEKEKGSIGMLQRMFKIGFNRAARIMDQLAEAGVVGEEEGTKPRKIIMTLEEFEDMLKHQ